MRSYDRTLYPPGPVVSVRFVHPTTGVQSALVRGRLDTGAGVTVIPEELLAQLGLYPQAQMLTTSFDGSRSSRGLYFVGVNVEGFSLPSVRCVAASRDDALLGRNVLNNFIITLDGKSLAFDLEDP
jgi:predicted aspartyl protease